MPKKLRVLMVAVILAVMAGACGSSEEGSSARESGPQNSGPAAADGTGKDAAKEPTAIDAVQVAYRETAAEQTAKTSFKMTTTGPRVDREEPGGAAPMTMTVTGEGVMDLSGQEAILSMEMPGTGAAEVRQIGDVVYAKLPEGFAMQAAGGKPWLWMNAEDVYGGSGQARDGVSSDPTRQLEYLRGVSDSVEKVGSEKVRGVQTTRYKATIDLQKMVEEQGGEISEEHRNALRQTGMEKLPVEVWIDDQSRVRRYLMDISMDAGQGGPRMRIVAEYYDFGTPINVQAPPPSQTTDARKVMPDRQGPVQRAPAA